MSVSSILIYLNGFLPAGAKGNLDRSFSFDLSQRVLTAGAIRTWGLFLFACYYSMKFRACFPLGFGFIGRKIQEVWFFSPFSIN